MTNSLYYKGQVYARKRNYQMKQNLQLRQFLPNRHGHKTIKLKIIASLTTPKRHISKQIKKVQLDSIIEMANRTFNNH